ncbi:MAG: Gfo/Idh/MocA family oxidoreductase [Hoeflea sp.]|uniref:Gfo/Idh/MocA family protein n=1 Tax=Hoeflea sp. TaxID=1940281 RepID=UPI001DCF7CFB|nr:Gfo/Idh/MocA family oxidoreductase [Hoeflea sp.]MBU4527325.1 Gfo/Idh/MocA family oxidoreductase [Alphaproteobacteria bacterium]MBU4546892.1 Gfo/Idh/MocA family oxidoreductase [Alphaproteobacteria bacterium]MBU4551596.1 Gfo/Idh/MocA family oxidoreductase [Alphaproteobacteria bacterium]MBV1725601.1 Gfo/Idh/MocA family oxidoreductase [Hoeflea sp.]MBV1759649.1 Gfo/Idh/MocA family oxidoreductase [Hoeflea sp.]
MTQTKTIRWGIAGTGAIAGQFADDMRHAKGAALAAVCSRDPARAEHFASQHADVTTYGSLTAMIGSGKIDAVYIATPNMVHRAQALECIAARMPVMVEKPITASLDEALEIRAAARSSGSFVMEAMWSRYLPAIKAARRALADGIIGTILKLEADIAWKQDYDPRSRFFDPTQGGGSLHDLGVYPVSLARFFLGEPDEVEGSWTAAPSGVDMAASLRMRFGGIEAELGCGFDRNGSNRMIIEGDKGVMVIGPLFIKAFGYGVYPSRRLADLLQPGETAGRIRRNLLQRMPIPGVARHDFRFEGSGLQFEIEAASDAIRQDLSEEPDNTLDDTIAALRIINTVLSSPPSGDWKP